MAFLPRALFRITAFTAFSLSIVAQTGPRLSVGPGLIYTIASRASVGINPAAKFNAVAYWNPGNGPATVYVADAHQEGSLNLGYVYAINLASGQVSVYAGSSAGATVTCTPGTPAVCPGDGRPAVNAMLNTPTGLAVDSAGNLFIADGLQNVIRRVDAATKVITTVAGVGGAPAPGNDNVPATQANLEYPTGLVFDAANNLYVADTLSNRVRKIALGGSQVITTVAGRIDIGAGFGGDNGPATSAQLNQPTGVALDSSGNIFIADSQNNVIRRVSGGVITTVAGQGTVAGYTGDGGSATAATLRYPRDLVVDAGSNLYITDTQNNVIRKVTGDVSHTISTLAGNATAGYSGDGGPALRALLNNTGYVASDAQNNLYIVDNLYTAVREITSSPAPLTLPLTAVGADGASPYPLTISNTGDQTLNITSLAFPNNFVAGSGGTCTPGAITLAAGASCTLPVTFTPTSGGSTSGNLTFTSNSNTGNTTNVTLSESNGLYFVPISPCRVIDTRLPDPTYGGGAFRGNETRNYTIRNSSTVGCASAPIPANADVQAYALNVTVVPQGRLDYLTVYPSSTTRPDISTLNSYDGRTKANAAIVPANTSDANRGISIYAYNPTHVIVDITGYYVPEASSTNTTNGQQPLAFYPLPPCRAVDTRTGSGLLGAGSPILGGAQGVTYTLGGVCNLPAGAPAYALNYTAVPRNGMALSYLTTWPAGIQQPVVSTLNATTGAVTANAAIVATGTGANAGKVSVFSTADTDLIIDVAGYYAPPASGGLALYNVTPCRAFDSRNPGSNPLAAKVSASFNIASGGTCSVPATAQSFVLNTTVLPGGLLLGGPPVSYITTWGTGSAQPLQSVLNAYDGAVSSNLAVVPTFYGNISVFASDSTSLLLDLSAYFAP